MAVTVSAIAQSAAAGDAHQGRLSLMRSNDASVDENSVTRLSPRPASGKLLLARTIIVCLAGISNTAYIIVLWNSLNPSVRVFGLVFFMFELWRIARFILFLITCRKLPNRAPPPAPDRRTVDVFVPTYNEPVDIVATTIIAAQRITYPHETWLLDDGNRAEMKCLAAELGCKYLARETNADAKAGNLNHALGHATGDFVAVFDSDHIAAPDFLDRTLGYFSDARVAFVQSPQEFYNYNSYQHMGADRQTDPWTEHSLFYRVEQRGRDNYNAAMMCGCSMLVRRAALDCIGGFATGTVTEDMHTALRLHAAGWSSVYHPETLAVGLAPADGDTFRRQRQRWAQGAMQVFMQEKIVTSRGLTDWQKLCYLMHIAGHLDSFRVLLNCVIPVFIVMLGVNSLITLTTTTLLFCATNMAISLLAYQEVARGYGRFLQTEAYALARCIPAMIGSCALVSNKQIAFKVTRKLNFKSEFPILSAAIAAISLLNIFFLINLFLNRTRSFDISSGYYALAWTLIVMIYASLLFPLTWRCNRLKNEPVQFRTPGHAAILYPGSDLASARLMISTATSTSIVVGPIDAHAPELTGRHLIRLSVFGLSVDAAATFKSRPDGTAFGSIHWTHTIDQYVFAYGLAMGRLRHIATFDATDCNTLFSFGQKLSKPKAVASTAKC